MTLNNNQLPNQAKSNDELPTAPVTGPNKGAFWPKDVGGVTEGFYTDDQGRDIQLTNNGSPIAQGEVNTASNVGGQNQLFKQKTGSNLEFRTILAGANVTVTQTADTIEIAAVGGGGGGEANTASNVGLGAGSVFKQKVGVDLEFRKIKAGANVTVSQVGDDIEIASSAGSSIEEFNFKLPAAATLNGRLASVVGLPANWTLDTADNAGVGEFGSSADTLVMTWDVALGERFALDVKVLQETVSGPSVTQGTQHLDLTNPGDVKTNVLHTKGAAALSGKGLDTAKNIWVFVKLMPIAA